MDIVKILIVAKGTSIGDVIWDEVGDDRVDDEYYLRGELHCDAATACFADDGQWDMVVIQATIDEPLDGIRLAQCFLRDRPGQLMMLVASTGDEVVEAMALPVYTSHPNEVGRIFWKAQQSVSNPQ